MEKILVTGATGKLGNEVVNLLLKKIDAKNLSVLLRDMVKAENLIAKGVTVHKGDYLDYGSLVNAFKGIDKLYFISTNDFSNREIQHENVVKAAVESKVKHIVYTSFQRKNESANSPASFITNVHVFTDNLIKASGLTYTILKHGLYADFIPILIGDKVFEKGQIFLPAGEGKVAFTSRQDLAKGAITVLTGKGHENKVYEFCSDKLYTISDIAQILSKIKNISVKYISPTQQEYKDTMIKSGVPVQFVNMFAGCAEAIRQGEFEISDTTLANQLSGKCTDMETFFKDVYKAN
jgi:NAD(P)H dehydrogenase (quinone)